VVADVVVVATTARLNTGVLIEEYIYVALPNIITNVVKGI